LPVGARVRHAACTATCIIREGRDDLDEQGVVAGPRDRFVEADVVVRDRGEVAV
jgi:hypothetical protein